MSELADIAPAVATSPVAFVLGLGVGMWLAGRYRLRILGPRRGTSEIEREDGDGER